MTPRSARPDAGAVPATRSTVALPGGELHVRASIVATMIGGWATAVALLGAVLLLGCNGPRVIHESPVLRTGARVPLTDGAADATARRRALDQSSTRRAADSIATVAAAGCDPALCAALARGEVTVGMTETQVLAATRTAPDAWAVHRAGAATTLRVASVLAPPTDAIGELASVQLTDGRVAAVAYREPQGVRVVQGADTTGTARARATAAALIGEGDAMVAAGDRAAALDRYDRALVLRPDDAMLQYRVATLLDQQLRPIEALMRYQRFLLQLELQRIDAVGTANAKLAEAIARAQQRILVLERQGR